MTGSHSQQGREEAWQHCRLLSCQGPALESPQAEKGISPSPAQGAHPCLPPDSPGVWAGAGRRQKALTGSGEEAAVWQSSSLSTVLPASKAEECPLCFSRKDGRRMEELESATQPPVCVPSLFPKGQKGPRRSLKSRRTHRRSGAWPCSGRRLPVCTPGRRLRDHTARGVGVCALRAFSANPFLPYSHLIGSSAAQSQGLSRDRGFWGSLPSPYCPGLGRPTANTTKAGR